MWQVISVSFIVGLLMDRIGLGCSALTLLLSMLQMMVLAVLSDHRQWMIFGFFVYVMCFRQFLFPVTTLHLLTAETDTEVFFGLLVE
jgi:hypothetical protein